MSGLPHSTHWGSFRGVVRDGQLRVTPRPGDPDPSPILRNVASAVGHRARVLRPAVRRGWWEDGPGPDERRGVDDYLEVGWDEVLDRLAAELRRVRDRHGPGAVYGGSYGWASAGRFHHAQSQLHRFLNLAVGGYTRSVGTYSGAAAETLLRHVLGPSEAVSKGPVTWEQVATHTDTVLAFGGMALKNSAVSNGGVSAHVEREAMAAAAARGARFVLISPLRSDLPKEAGAEWLPVPPGSDVALMFGLMHTLLTDGLHDAAFLDRYCVGWDQLAAHLLGGDDGVVRDARWAAGLTGIEPATIVELARRAASGATLVTVAQSLQRAEFGEQPVWAGVALAAALGQIGRPGAGFVYGLGSIGNYGRSRVTVPIAPLPQGHNSVHAFIPVARVADMLLHPDEEFDHDGRRLRYPKVRLAYWAGGNPFHHHQDLGRLRRALRTLDTFVVHEPAWTASARHADVVLPTTWTIEREDIGASSFDPRIHPADAAARGITEGDIVLVANDRGSCLAAATVTDGILAGVVQLPTGAWFDPADLGAAKPFCVHGNPNVLTRDSGTSSLAQGCTGQHTVVQVSRYTGVLPPVRAYDPPI